MSTMARAFQKMREAGITKFLGSIRIQIDVLYDSGDMDHMYVEEIFEDRSFRWNELPINRENRGTSGNYYASECQVREVSLRRSLTRGLVLKFSSKYTG